MTKRRILRDVAELHALRPAPSARVAHKEIDHIDAICARFLSASPYCVLATRNGDRTDVSPRGDASGFVRILDRNTLAIADKPGNNRLDSFANIIRDPRLALLCLIPGHGDCLRIIGRGEVVVDPDLAATMPGRRPADLILLITVQTAFLHCSRALVRSGLWKPDAWPDRGNVPSLAQAMVAHGGLPDDTATIDAIFAANDAVVLGEE